MTIRPEGRRGRWAHDVGPDPRRRYAAHRCRPRRPAAGGGDRPPGARSRSRVRSAEALQRVPYGALPADAVVDHVLVGLPPAASSLRSVINATGVVVHTNLGRAPLSAAAIDAVVTVAGHTDVELDLLTGRRTPRTWRPGRAGRRRPRCRAPSTSSTTARPRSLYVTCALGAGRRGGRGPWRAGGDRRRVPHPRAAGVRRRPAPRGRDHQPCTPRPTTRTSSARQTAFVLKVHPVQLPGRGLHLLGARRRSGRARRPRRGRHRVRPSRPPSATAR